MNKDKSTGACSSFKRFGLFFLLLFITGFVEADRQLSDSLRDSLKETGWSEYQSEDGSVIYRRPEAESVPDTTPDVTDEQERRRLGEALKQRGWEASWQVDGSLVIKPAKGENTSEAIDKPVSLQSRAYQIPDLPGFEYWRIEKGEDGSMMFHPLVKTRIDKSSGDYKPASGECVIYLPSTVRVQLPVDEWAEAKELAQAWLDMSGRTGMQVGRIRKVLRVYMVSLVGDSAPYRLKHQLAIRASDGGAILLD
ncbi:MAG: hypothetical protein ABW162_07140 [Candidatus Sedimenticola sp. PURPLELP]